VQYMHGGGGRCEHGTPEQEHQAGVVSAAAPHLGQRGTSLLSRLAVWAVGSLQPLHQGSKDITIVGWSLGGQGRSTHACLCRCGGGHTAGTEQRKGMMQVWAVQ
jgi:hypothetical protein